MTLVISPYFGYTISRYADGRYTYLTLQGEWIFLKTATEEEKSQILRFSASSRVENHYEIWEKTKERKMELEKSAELKQRIEHFLSTYESAYINLRTDDVHDLLDALDAAEVRIAELEEKVGSIRRTTGGVQND